MQVARSYLSEHELGTHMPLTPEDSEPFESLRFVGEETRGVLFPALRCYDDLSRSMKARHSYM
jgi:hypothetical protein